MLSIPSLERYKMICIRSIMSILPESILVSHSMDVTPKVIVKPCELCMLEPAMAPIRSRVQSARNKEALR